MKFYQFRRRKSLERSRHFLHKSGAAAKNVLCKAATQHFSTIFRQQAFVGFAEGNSLEKTAIAVAFFIGNDVMLQLFVCNVNVQIFRLLQVKVPKAIFTVKALRK